MLKLCVIVAGSASLLVGPAIASEQTSIREAASSLNAPPSAVRSDEDAARARSSLAWNNVFAAANLMEQANQGASTVLTRFNLATAYERTGRLREAAALYRGLVTDGQFTNAILDPRYDEPNLRPRWINLADESAARLAVLDRLAAARQASAQQPFSATEAGENAAATEGVSRASTSATAISDRRALEIDAAARAARRAHGAP